MTASVTDPGRRCHRSHYAAHSFDFDLAIVTTEFLVVEQEECDTPTDREPAPVK